MFLYIYYVNVYLNICIHLSSIIYMCLHICIALCTHMHLCIEQMYTNVHIQHATPCVALINFLH
jgi:hypothetical protein